jgi:AbrB family looped-hinge helix DNA binding protein
MSTKGQVVIPKDVRDSHHWEPGQKLILIDTEDGIVLKDASPYKKRDVDDVAGCLQHSGRTKSIEEMEDGIKRAVRGRGI